MVEIASLALAMTQDAMITRKERHYQEVCRLKTFISIFVLYICVFTEPLFAENLANYNIANTPVQETESKNTLFENNKDKIEAIIPEEYWTESLFPRDKDPISRLSQGVDTGAPQKTDLRIKATNAMLDFLFGSLTRNKLIFNIIPDKKDALSVQVQPIKNLTLQFNTSPERAIDTSSVEIKLQPNDNTSISLKTQEENNGTKTGIEIQMAF